MFRTFIRKMSLTRAIEFVDKAKPLYICKNNDLISVVSDTEQSLWVEYLANQKVVSVSPFLDTLSFPENVIRMKKLEHLLTHNLETKFKSSFFEIISGFQCNLKEDIPSQYKEVIAFLTHQDLEFDCDDFVSYILKLLSEQFNNEKPLPELSVISANRVENEIIVSTYEKDHFISSVYVAVEPPNCHPAFADEFTNSVSHSITSVLQQLKPFYYKKEVNDLTNICLPYIGDLKSLPLKQKHPVIVIEGLDACGKSTLTANLAKAINGSLLKSPPKCVSHLRKVFDKYPPSLRRLYYSLSNYAFAAMILDHSQCSVVICDRFWHSTAAYAIATDVKVGDKTNLPYKGHTVYDWPCDLMKPDIVYFLNVTEEERIRRLRKRNIQYTDEEDWLIKSKHFKQRMDESYKRMINPHLVYVDANKSENELCSFVIQDLRNRSII